MLKRLLTATLVVAITCLPTYSHAQDDGSASITGEIFTQVKKLDIKRLAICPRIVSRDKDGNNPSFNGDLGPLADQMVRLFRAEVNRVNEDGQYNIQIVPEGALQPIFQSTSAADLYEEATHSKLRQHADALIVFFHNSSGTELPAVSQIKTTMMDIRKPNQPSESVNRNDPREWTLSDAAYAGRSFIVRELRENVVQPIKFKNGSRLPKEASYGAGHDWEVAQWNDMEHSGTHPMQDATNPFGFEVAVNGEVRPVWINPKDGKAYVVLNKNEEFSIHLRNKSGQTVLQSLLIDGVNSISQAADLSKEPHHPEQTTFARHWFTKPVESYYPIDGYFGEWSGKTGQSTSKSRRFKVTLNSDAVARNAGVTDRFGMLSVIVYALRNQGYAEYTEKAPQTLIASKGDGQFSWGIGAGVEADKTVEGQTGERGVMLAAMTIHYVDAKTLQELQGSKDEDKKDENKTKDDKKDENKTNENKDRPMPPQPPVPPVAPTKPKTNGEEKPF